MTDEAWVVHGTVVEVHDGDTVYIDLDLGWRTAIRKEPVRVLGVNAPELNTPAGKASRAFLAGLLPPGTKVKVESRRWLGEREKYGRALARISSEAGGDVALALLSAGHAKPWDGRGARP